MTTTTVDPKTEKKLNIMKCKAAVQKGVMSKGSDGKPRPFFFAMAPGKDRTSHILKLDHRKKGLALVAEIKKTAKDRKQLCFGTVTAVKEDGKVTLYIKYVKKLSGAERKIREALKDMRLLYAVQLETEDEISDDDIPANEDEHEDASPQGDDGDDASSQADEDDDASPQGDEDGSSTDDEDDDRSTSEDEETEPEEEDEDSDKEEGGARPKEPAHAAQVEQLAKARDLCKQARLYVLKTIDTLTSTILEEYKDQGSDVVADIGKGIAQFKQIADRIDHRLADQLDRAYQAKDDATRKAELARAKAILVEQIKYVTSDPLIAEFDGNPFVKTNLKGTLHICMTEVAKVVKVG